MMPQHEETGGVVGFVFDAGGKDVQSITLCGGFACNGAGFRFFGGQAGSFGIADYGQAFGLGQVTIEPFMALRQRLWVGIDAAWRLFRIKRGDFAQQILVYPQVDLATNPERGREEQVEGASDRSFRRVFDRNDGVIGVSRLDCAENFINAGAGSEVGRVAEMLVGGHFGEGAHRPQEGDAQGLLQREAGGHDFTHDTLHGFVGQGAGLASAMRRKTWASRSGR